MFDEHCVNKFDINYAHIQVDSLLLKGDTQTHILK